MYKMVRVKCFSAMMIQDNQNNELSDRQIQTSQYLATLYIAVLILSLRHQTLFFIMRNHSFPYFDQFSAWRKWHTGIFFWFPVIGSTPVYSEGFTYQYFLKYVSMGTSLFEDLPQVLILICYKIALLTSSGEGATPPTHTVPRRGKMLSTT